MICRVEPYTGTEPYIFLSYCHKDASRVYPIFEQMAMNGYRLWYDSGNHAGDDWLTTIEEYLDNCSVVVAFFSEASSLSNNCKGEVTYAMKTGKKVLPILLGTEELPKGMRMLLSYLHYLKASDYSSDLPLLEKLYEAEELKACKGTPTPLFAKPDVPDTKDSKSDIHEKVTPPAPDSNPHPPKKVVKIAVKRNKKQADFTPDVPKAPQNEAEQNVVSAESFSQPKIPDTIAEDDQPTILGTGVDAPPVDDSGQTVYEGYRDAAILIQPSVGKVSILSLPQTKIGRSALTCDVVIEGNGSISKHHADIIHTTQGWYLVDSGSLNGSYLNGSRLEANAQTKLNNPAVFQLNDEYLVLITDELAWMMLDAKQVPVLINEATSAVQVMASDVFTLNRNNKWPDGTLGDNTVHREAHAMIQKSANRFQLINQSPRNTTCVNDTLLKLGDIIPLSSGDRIRLGDHTTLKFLLINLQGDV